MVSACLARKAKRASDNVSEIAIIESDTITHPVLDIFPHSRMHGVTTQYLCHPYEVGLVRRSTARA